MLGEAFGKFGAGDGDRTRNFKFGNVVQVTFICNLSKCWLAPQKPCRVNQFSGDTYNA